MHTIDLEFRTNKWWQWINNLHNFELILIILSWATILLNRLFRQFFFFFFYQILQTLIFSNTSNFVNPFLNVFKKLHFFIWPNKNDKSWRIFYNFNIFLLKRRQAVVSTGYNSTHATQHSTSLYGHNSTPHNFKRPQLDTAQLNTPQLDTPQFDTSQLDTTQLYTPTILHGHNSTLHIST